MKTIKAVVVGYGNRGGIYASYEFDHKDEFKVISVVDKLSYRLEEAGKLHNISENLLFSSLDDFLSAGIECDIVIDATMDQEHYETAIKIINAGYNLLLEKPITPNPKELKEINDLVKEKGVQMFVCHVMRYAPFFTEVKKIINKGVIGKIVSMQLNEHVSVGHFLNSYVRGRWNSEERCGSGFLLAKCCHDLDLMCWLNNQTLPEDVSSFGSRGYFNKENAPEGSAEYCYDCKYLESCQYSAKLAHLMCDDMPFVTWEGINKPLTEITYEEKENYLRSSIFGQCAYKIDSNLVDRQCVSVNFKNGSIGTLNMIGGTTKGGRTVHILGSKGEIQGYWNSSKFTLRTYNARLQEFTEKEFDVSELVRSGHLGSDEYIIRDLVAYLNGDNSSVSITKIEDSINGHLCVYAAETSRKEKRIVNIKKEYGNE